MDQQVVKSRFNSRDIGSLSKTLNQVAQIMDISWEFKEEELEVHGFFGTVITFGHPRSARAFFDGFLEGYGEGFAAGRAYEENNDETPNA